MDCLNEARRPGSACTHGKRSDVPEHRCNTWQPRAKQVSLDLVWSQWVEEEKILMGVGNWVEEPEEKLLLEATAINRITL